MRRQAWACDGRHALSGSPGTHDGRYGTASGHLRRSQADVSAPHRPRSPQIAPNRPQIDPEATPHRPKSTQVGPKSPNIDPDATQIDPESAPHRPESTPNRPRIDPDRPPALVMNETHHMQRGHERIFGQGTSQHDIFPLASSARPGSSRRWWAPKCMRARTNASTCVHAHKARTRNSLRGDQVV